MKLYHENLLYQHRHQHKTLYLFNAVLFSLATAYEDNNEHITAATINFFMRYKIQIGYKKEVTGIQIYIEKTIPTKKLSPNKILSD